MSVSRSAQAVDTADVLRIRTGRLGHLVLNRPRSMNALTHNMIVMIGEALTEWAADDEVQTVLITGSGDRALCAGGDIVSIYRQVQHNRTGAARFFADEYAVNALIARYPKPIVAIMDGVVLGGGVGVSAHAGIRVVTERTQLGMPETVIGFAPDVGGTFLLSRSPGELGTHMALTSAVVTGPDAIIAGFADYMIDSGNIAGLVTSLADTDARAAVRALARVPGTSPLNAQREWIDTCYEFDDVEDILACLQLSPVEAANRAAEDLLARSPTALKVTLESLRRARNIRELEDVLNQEYRVSLRFLDGTEFVEGIRAQVIDKDRSPRWAPATLGGVTEDAVNSFFGSLGARELSLPVPSVPSTASVHALPDMHQTETPEVDHTS